MITLINRAFEFVTETKERLRIVTIFIVLFSLALFFFSPLIISIVVSGTSAERFGMLFVLLLTIICLALLWFAWGLCVYALGKVLRRKLHDNPD
ncbi:MAG: hypothetical protein COU85_00450 [Candidatus Portnoybacteria bacterium CG10_big_fil_rev_8_21_14_0_10_44_7]|uniref:Uncharacterized protein n=1 Tax=Candidatus Portnoybacteria bacterium CG10_big_fil_rev_8_21_14_0_10_44_7 TaxID=1974816 RepID=A0A2M8KJF6_9BACT|nr:MAG: hypothetical protein COU85_00450 [Candidatus Portnoybacteria bacterium CG10_big_fil_rev_8_21_14_0_10_44_7]